MVDAPGRRNRTPLTVEEVDAIRTRLSAGDRAVDIARDLGVHRWTVWQAADRKVLRPVERQASSLLDQ